MIEEDGRKRWIIALAMLLYLAAMPRAERVPVEWPSSLPHSTRLPAQADPTTSLDSLDGFVEGGQAARLHARFRPDVPRR
jgi:hypothetical protein